MLVDNQCLTALHTSSAFMVAWITVVNCVLYFAFAIVGITVHKVYSKV